MAVYQKVPDGKRYHPSYGRIMEHQGYATRIFWNKDMLDYLRQHYATTLNEELAGCLGVSPRTMIRKARELGLEKDPAWLSAVWDERRKMAHVISKRMGYPGGFAKGQRANPAGEFKPGEPRSEEMRRRQGDGMKRWYKRHPREASAKALKAWETRRRNNNLKSENQ